MVKALYIAPPRYGKCEVCSGKLKLYKDEPKKRGPTPKILDENYKKRREEYCDPNKFDASEFGGENTPKWKMLSEEEHLLMKEGDYFNRHNYYKFLKGRKIENLSEQIMKLKEGRRLRWEIMTIDVSDRYEEMPLAF